MTDTESVPERGEQTSPLRKNPGRGGVSPPVGNRVLLAPTEKPL